MGQRSLSTDNELNFQMSNWVEAVQDSSTTRFANINSYRKRLLMNKLTSELIEEYELQFFNQQDFNSFLAQIQLRKQHTSQKPSASNRADHQLCSSPYIYKIKHFQNMSIKEMCSTIYDGLLYIEKIDLRLKDVNDIPFHDQLYLLNACLHGFKVLYEKAGVFQINEEMIFFNQIGEVKVWLSPNLSSFQPNFQPQYYNSLDYNETQGSQTDMLRNLIHIIESNTDAHAMSQNLQFKDYLLQKGLIDRLSFSKAIQYFQIYCQENRFHLPTHMSSIYELFHYEQSVTQTHGMQTSEVHKFNINNQLDTHKFAHNTPNIQDDNKNSHSSHNLKPPIRQQNTETHKRQQNHKQQTKGKGRLSAFLQRSQDSRNSHLSQNQHKIKRKEFDQPNLLTSQKIKFDKNQKNLNSHINVYLDTPKLSPQQSNRLSIGAQPSNPSSIFNRSNEPNKLIAFRQPENNRVNIPTPQSHKIAPVSHLSVPFSAPINRYKSLDKSQNHNAITVINLNQTVSSSNRSMNPTNHTNINFSYKSSPTAPQPPMPTLPLASPPPQTLPPSKMPISLQVSTPPVKLTPIKNTNQLIEQPVKYPTEAQTHNAKRKQSIIDKLSSPFTSPMSGTDFFGSEIRKLHFYQSDPQLQPNLSNTKYNYYSSTSEYTLDNEIANDMVKYLGYNPGNL